jgi:thermitase
MSLSPQLRRHGAALLVIFALAAGLVAARPASSASPTTRLLVKFKPQASADARSNALFAAAARPLKTIAGIDVQVVTVTGEPGAALGRLRLNGAVEFAEPDAILTPQEVLPSDPYFPRQYALGGGAWGWYQTHTTQAWDITQGSPSVVIAVLDTGLKTAGLSDFGGQVVTGWNVLSKSTDTSSQAGNHGTYVAGVVGLAMGNGAGNAGFCPGCRIMPVQVGTDSGANLSDLAAGLTWAADHGARVANMSWAGTSSSSTLQSAIAYARSKGLVLTAAAGNSNCDCRTYPAGYAGVLAVGGTSNSGGKAGDSNYGTWVTLAAPEGNLTAWPTINGAPGYAPVGGTSLAAPVVAGIAGLLLSYDAGLTNAQVEQALEASAAPVPFSVQYGRVDALAALRYLGATDPQPSSAPVQTAPAQLYYTLNGTTAIAPLTTAPQPGQMLVRGFGGWAGSAGLAVNGLQWQRCDAAGLACTTVATTGTYTVQPADAGSTLRLIFSVGNGIGSVGASVLTPVVGGTAAPPTAAPVNVSPPTLSGTAQSGQTLTAAPGSWSGSPTGYSYAWQRCDSAGAACATVGRAGSSSYVLQSVDVGTTLRVSVTASNAGGSATSVSAPTAVVAGAPAPAPSPSPTAQTVTFSGSLNPGNPTRTFSIAVGAGSASASLSFTKCSSMTLSLSNGSSASGPSVVKLDAPLGGGTYTYTVGGGKCSFTLTVAAPLP